MASGGQINQTTSSSSSTSTSTSSISSPMRSNAPPSSMSSNTSSTASTSSNSTTKPSRSKAKSGASNSKSNSTTSSPTSSGNVLPKGIPTGPDAPPQICSNCQTTSTPLWRRDGKGGLCCNSCQLWAKTKGYPRPMSLKTDVIKPRIRQSKGGPKKKTKKQLALEAAQNDGVSPTSSNNTSSGTGKKVKKQSDGLISGENSPDPNDRESSPDSSRSYSRSYSGSASPPPSTSGRGSVDGYHLSHSQHLPTPPSGLQHSIHSSNGGVNLPSLSRLFPDNGQKAHPLGGHQSAPTSHRPSLDGSHPGNWSPTISDAEQEAAYALASNRSAGKLPEPTYNPHYSHSHSSQRTISRRGSVPSLFGTGGLGPQSSNLRGRDSGSASASASGESSPRSVSHVKTEDVSEYYSNMNVSGRPLPPLKRERDSDPISGVNIPGTSTHHSTSSLRASTIAGEKDGRGRIGPDGEALRFGVSPRSRADVDAGFARGRPYSSLRDSETNPLFASSSLRYLPTGAQGPIAGNGSIGLSSQHPPPQGAGLTTAPPSSSSSSTTRGPGSRSHSQVPPNLGGSAENSRMSGGMGSGSSSRSSSAGRVVPMGSSTARASSLSRIDSSSNHSSPRGSPFASPRGSPSRTMEPLPSHHFIPHSHHVGGGHPQLNHQHPHAYHPYASPNHSPLLVPRDGISTFQQHPSHLSSHPQQQQQSSPHHSAAAALDVLGAAASERLIDEGLTSRSTVTTSTLPAIHQNSLATSSNNHSSASSPLNPNSNNASTQFTSFSTPTSPKRTSEHHDVPRGRTGGPHYHQGLGIATSSTQESGPAMAAQEGAMYFARRANEEGPALCLYHKSHPKNDSSEDPIDSMDLDDEGQPAHGAQPQLRYLDCGCSPDEALFELACERRGIRGLDPKSRRNLLSLERKKHGYREGDWDD